MAGAEAHGELCDVYDRHRRKVGRIVPRNSHTLSDNEYRMIVVAIVEDKRGRCLVTRRSRKKTWGARLWEIPGGGAMAGEDSLEAVRREFREETGLDLTGARGGYRFSYYRENPGSGDNYFVDVYRFRLAFSKKDVKVSPEAEGFRLLFPWEILKIGARGEFFHFQDIQAAFGAAGGL